MTGNGSGLRFALPFFTIVLAAACATQPEVNDSGAPPPDKVAGTKAGTAGGEVVAMSFGKGEYAVATDARVAFVFDAERTADGKASGYFRYHGADANGLVDLSGTIACLSLDSEKGRAWIGGQISANRSSTGAASVASLPVGAPVGFVVEDATKARRAALSFPVVLTSAAAAKFCTDHRWDSSALIGIDVGTLGVFP